MAVQAQADDTYDATGLVDLTFGSGRRLHFVTAARHLDGGPWLVPGLAVRDRPGSSPVTAVCGLQHRLIAPLERRDAAGLAFATEVPDLRYEWSGTLTETGVDVVETVFGRPVFRTLLVPYLRDLGGDITTQAAFLRVRGALQPGRRVGGTSRRRCGGAGHPPAVRVREPAGTLWPRPD